MPDLHDDRTPELLAAAEFLRANGHEIAADIVSRLSEPMVIFYPDDRTRQQIIDEIDWAAESRRNMILLPVTTHANLCDQIAEDRGWKPLDVGATMTVGFGDGKEFAITRNADRWDPAGVVVHLPEGSTDGR